MEGNHASEKVYTEPPRFFLLTPREVPAVVGFWASPGGVPAVCWVLGPRREEGLGSIGEKSHVDGFTSMINERIVIKL